MVYIFQSMVDNGRVGLIEGLLTGLIKPLFLGKGRWGGG